MIKMTQIDNKPTSGVCRQCGQNSNRILTPPLILPPDWNQVAINGDQASWEPAGWNFPYPSAYAYSLAFQDGTQFLRPFGITNDPVCWVCFINSISAADFEFVVNKPDQLVLVPGEFTPPTIGWSE
jgi:hypothetical protein